MRVFTRDELKKYNGKDGKKAYVGYEGKVYDVSGSFLWQDGNHQALHNAGEDLTEAIKQAPHGDEFIKMFPVVGKIIEASNEP